MQSRALPKEWQNDFQLPIYTAKVLWQKRFFRAATEQLFSEQTAWCHLQGSAYSHKCSVWSLISPQGTKYTFTTKSFKRAFVLFLPMQDCANLYRLVHTELWQRKRFFLQEWVTLVSMEVLTWRPVAKTKAKVSSSIGIYAQLWQQWQLHSFLCLCCSSVWTRLMKREEKWSKRYAFFYKLQCFSYKSCIVRLWDMLSKSLAKSS